MFLPSFNQKFFEVFFRGFLCRFLPYFFSKISSRDSTRDSYLNCFRASSRNNPRIVSGILLATPSGILYQYSFESFIQDFFGIPPGILLRTISETVSGIPSRFFLGFPRHFFRYCSFSLKIAPEIHSGIFLKPYKFLYGFFSGITSKIPLLIFSRFFLGFFRAILPKLIMQFNLGFLFLEDFKIFFRNFSCDCFIDSSKVSFLQRLLPEFLQGFLLKLPPEFLHLFC